MANDKLSFRLSPLALLTLLLGVTGPFALFLGYLSLYQINASDGKLRGRSLAYIGLALGALTSIAMLLGFAAIGITQLRVTASRAECINNLRTIGSAVHQYHDDHDKVYPPAAVSPSELPADKRLSFFALLLPYVEQRPGAAVNNAALAKTLDLSQPWDAAVHQTAMQTTIPNYLCRDDSGFASDRRGITNYVGISGIGADAALLPKESPRAGFFGYNRLLRQEDIKAGTSYVVMLTETIVDNGPWLAAGRPTLRALSTDAARYFGADYPFGGLHHGGANALHVDGSVLLLGDEMNPQVFRALVTLHHEKVDEIAPP
jgi:hypothetical protein